MIPKYRTASLPESAMATDIFSFGTSKSTYFVVSFIVSSSFACSSERVVLQLHFNLRMCKWGCFTFIITFIAIGRPGSAGGNRKQGCSCAKSNCTAHFRFYAPAIAFIAIGRPGSADGDRKQGCSCGKSNCTAHFCFFAPVVAFIAIGRPGSAKGELARLEDFGVFGFDACRKSALKPDGFRLPARKR